MRPGCRSGPDAAATLHAQLQDLDDDLLRQTQLRDRLASALANPEPDQLMKVIETMTMFGQYVHWYQPAESARLGDQADALVELLHGDTRFEPGERVLEMGCGVGAQTVTLATRSPGTALVSVDISPDSLEVAARRRCAERGVVRPRVRVLLARTSR